MHSALPRCRCVGASCKWPTVTTGANEQLRHIDARRQAAKAHNLCKLEIVQHGGVHELQRACRHVDREDGRSRQKMAARFLPCFLLDAAKADQADRVARCGGRALCEQKTVKVFTCETVMAAPRFKTTPTACSCAKQLVKAL